MADGNTTRDFGPADPDGHGDGLVFTGNELHHADFAAHPDVMTAAAQGRLKTIVERIERLEEDKAGVMADLKEVYAEAKAEGYDTKTIRKVVRLRGQDRAKRREEEALLDLYLSAIGEV